MAISDHVLSVARSTLDELHELMLAHLRLGNCRQALIAQLREELDLLRDARLKGFVEDSELCRVFRFAKDGSLQVMVSSSSGSRLCTVETVAGATTQDLKVMIEAQTSIPHAQQRLVHEARELQDHQALCSCLGDSCSIVSPLSPLVTLSRLECGKVFAVGGFDCHQTLASAEVYDPIVGAWGMLPSMAGPRSYLGTAFLEGKLYAIGGFDGEVTLSSGEVYHVDTGRWDLMPPMTISRSNCAAIAVDGKLYVIGGFDGYQSLDSVEAYDPSSDCWSSLPPMATPRSDLAVAASNGKIYAVGGYDGEPLAVAEVFDLAMGNWSSLPPMVVPRSDLAAAVVDDKLYTVGGSDGHQSQARLEVFDIPSSSWELSPYRPPALKHHATVALHGKLYTIGGTDCQQQHLASGETFDPSDGSWAHLPSMNTPRSSLGAVAAFI